MPMRSFDIPDELASFISTSIETERYGNASEVVVAALTLMEHEDQEYKAKLAALRAAIDEGYASGIAEGDVFAQVREELGLPPRRPR